MTFQTLQHVHKLLVADVEEKQEILHAYEEKFNDWCDQGENRWQDAEHKYAGYRALEKARLDERHSRAALEDFNEKEWN